MTTHNFYKAQGFRDKPVESQTLVFDEPIPDNLPLGEWGKLLNLQAEGICNILTSTLAQGVTDRILAILMARRATLFIFPQSHNE